MDILRIALLVFIAELPCMIRTTALKLESGNLWGVVWGTILGSALALIGGLAIAKGIESAVSAGPYLNWFAGGTFILLGLYVIFCE